MAQQTAVEWLESKIYLNIKLYEPYNVAIKEFIIIAKQMEKEQIQKAFSDGQEIPINHPTLPHYSNEEYYNETFEK